MFSTEELGCLDPNYFVIIVKNPYDVTIKSKNTGHYWYLHNPEYPEQGTVIIFHKYKASHRTTSTVGRTPCGRRLEAYVSMINGI